MIFEHSFAFVIAFLLVNIVKGVNITRIDVETPIIAGEGGWLHCEWDKNAGAISSAKWYWGTREFYRWTPGARNPMDVFPQDVFAVDQSRSTEGHVYVSNVTLQADGPLRCEVSGEGPKFYTDFRDKKLQVVDLPDSAPIITGGQKIYEELQKVYLTCTSPKSKPAANLTFYINGEKAPQSWVNHRKTHTDTRTGLKSSTLGMEFTLLPRYLRDGIAVVKCAANLKNIYWNSSQRIIRTNAVPQDPPVMDEIVKNQHGTSSAAGVNKFSTRMSYLWTSFLIQIFFTYAL